MDEEIMGTRSRLLTVLCMLSLVNGIYGMLTGLSSAISPVDVDDTFLENLYAQLDALPISYESFRGELEDYYLSLMLNLGNLGAANFLFYGISVVGVVLMYRLNRIGFLLYLPAQLGIALAPAIFGGFSRFGLISLGVALTWNAVWVGLYASQRKLFYQ